MLTGKNGVLNRANEAKYTNEVAQFEEKVRLAQIALQAEITAKTKSQPGYIATETDDTFKALAKEVADELDVTEIKAPAASGTEINKEEYTVGYYLDTPGNSTTDGAGYIAIWYTSNSFRATLDIDEIISKYGIINIAEDSNSRNQATLVAAITVENYSCMLSNTALTSITYGGEDIGQEYFKDTSIKTLGKTETAGGGGGSGGGGVTPAKDKNGIEIASTTETTPYLPDASNNEITNNDLDTGLTIKDANQNEWVWIEVPKTGDIYKIAGVGQTLPDVPDNSEDSIYTKIEQDLRNYCKTDEQGGTLIAEGTASSSYKTTTNGYTDKYAVGKGIDSSDQYKEYKQKMLKSIYENGGFYIGKYEAGTETARGNKTDSLTTAVIKENAYPYNYVTNEQAENKAEELATGGKTTTLLFGVQWDLVLRHLSEKGVSTANLTGDSSDWGNYYNKAFRIDRGSYSTASPWKTFTPYTTVTANKVTVAEGVSTKVGTTSTNRILLTTGASDNNSKFNIYDLAGNVYELTLELTSDTNRPCAVRGGNFSNTGSDLPASVRNYYNTSSSYNFLRVSRFTLLVALSPDGDKLNMYQTRFKVVNKNRGGGSESEQKWYQTLSLPYQASHTGLA